jgi:hypothetical protein
MNTLAWLRREKPVSAAPTVWVWYSAFRKGMTAMTVYRRREDAWADLVASVRDWWQEDFPDEPLPAEDDDLVEEYSERSGNSITLHEAEFVEEGGADT